MILTFLRPGEDDPGTPGCGPDLRGCSRRDSPGSQTCSAPRPPPGTGPRHQQAAEDKKVRNFQNDALSSLYFSSVDG